MSDLALNQETGEIIWAKNNGRKRNSRLQKCLGHDPSRFSPREAEREGSGDINSDHVTEQELVVPFW